MGPLIGAAISGGVSLLSGLFGRSAAKKQAKREEQAIQKANEAASWAAAEANKRAEAAAAATREKSAAATKVANAGIKSAADVTDKALMTAAKVPIITTTKDDRGEYTNSSVDMAAFRKAAEDYGFNPLTFLRSGALSLFQKQATRYTGSTTQTVTGSKALDAAIAAGDIRMTAAQAAGNNLMTNVTAGDQFLGTGVVASPQPVLSNTRVPSVGEVFGGALNAGVNQYMAERSQQQQQAFQMDMLAAQLGGAQRHGATIGTGRFLSTPKAISSGGKVTSSTPGKSLSLGQFDLSQGRSSDAEDWENRYSDVVGNIAGIGILGHDVYTDAKRRMGNYMGVPPNSVALPELVYETGRKFLQDSGLYDPTKLSPWETVKKSVNNATASPTNPGKTWGEMFKEMGVSW